MAYLIDMHAHLGPESCVVGQIGIVQNHLDFGEDGVGRGFGRPLIDVIKTLIVRKRRSFYHLS